MLELKNLSFAASAESGTVDILKHIDLTVEDGKFIVITGPNGGGKTTLAKAIMGLVTPTEGQIIWNGEDVTGPFHHRPRQSAASPTAFSSRRASRVSASRTF